MSSIDDGSNDTTTNDDGPGSAPSGVGAVDVVLGIVGLPLVLVVLMFAISGMEGVLQHRARRRRLFAAVALTQALIVAAVLVLATR